MLALILTDVVVETDGGAGAATDGAIGNDANTYN